MTFFSQLQLPPGNWGCEYGGPMFLIPGLVITWYVTETPVPEGHSIELKNYLFARQAEDGGTLAGRVVTDALGREAEQPGECQRPRRTDGRPIEEIADGAVAARALADVVEVEPEADEAGHGAERVDRVARDVRAVALVRRSVQAGEQRE